MIIKLGITGNIGSGKSTFISMLLARLQGRASFFDSDACVHDLLEHDQDIREQISEKIDHNVYNAENHVNKCLLRKIIYYNLDMRKQLESILHPRVHAILYECILKCKTPIFIAEVPLLFEVNWNADFTSVITVACSFGTQLERIKKKYQNIELARKIIDSQMSMVSKLLKSDYVVWNDGSLASLNSQVDIFSNILP